MQTDWNLLSVSKMPILNGSGYLFFLSKIVFPTNKKHVACRFYADNRTVCWLLACQSIIIIITIIDIIITYYYL